MTVTVVLVCTSLNVLSVDVMCCVGVIVDECVGDSGWLGWDELG